MADQDQVNMNVGLGINSQSQRAFERQLDELQRKLPTIKLNVGGSGLSDMNRDLTQFQSYMDRANQRVISFTSSVSILYTTLSTFKSIVDNTLAVNEALTKINVTARLSAQGISEVGKALFDTARSTSSAWKEAADAMVLFQRQGLSVSESLSRTKDALTLAKLASIDTADAVRELTIATNVFEKAGVTSRQGLDALATVSSRFAISTKDLTDGFTRFGAAGQAAGLSLNQIISLITSARQVSQRDGAAIGTALTNIFTKLEPQTVIEGLSRIGVAVRNSQGQLLPMIDVLKNLAAQYGSFGDSTKAQIDKLVGGARQINILKAEFEGLATTSDRVTKALANSNGEAERQLATMNQSLNSRIQVIKDTFAQIGSNIGSVGLGTLSKTGSIAGTALSPLIDALKDADGQAKTLAGKIGESIIEGLGSALVLGLGPFVIRAIGRTVTSTLGSAFNDLKMQSGVMDGLVAKANEQARIEETINSLYQQGGDALQRQLNLVTNIGDRARLVAAQVSEMIATTEGMSLERSMVTTEATEILMAKKGVRAARGYLPIGAEQSAISAGVGGAPSSARAVTIPSFNYGGGKTGPIVANDSEWVVKAANGWSVYNRDMISQHGLPAGATPIAAGGYVPNAAGGAPFGQNSLRMDYNSMGNSNAGFYLPQESVDRLNELMRGIEKAGSVAAAQPLKTEIQSIMDLLNPASRKRVSGQLRSAVGSVGAREHISDTAAQASAMDVQQAAMLKSARDLAESKRLAAVFQSETDQLSAKIPSQDQIWSQTRRGQSQGTATSMVEAFRQMELGQSKSSPISANQVSNELKAMEDDIKDMEISAAARAATSRSQIPLRLVRGDPFQSGDMQQMLADMAGASHYAVPQAYGSPIGPQFSYGKPIGPVMPLGVRISRGIASGMGGFSSAVENYTSGFTSRAGKLLNSPNGRLTAAFALPMAGGILSSFAKDDSTGSMLEGIGGGALQGAGLGMMFGAPGAVIGGAGGAFMGGMSIGGKGLQSRIAAAAVQSDTMSKEQATAQSIIAMQNQIASAVGDGNTGQAQLLIKQQRDLLNGLSSGPAKTQLTQAINSGSAITTSQQTALRANVDDIYEQQRSTVNGGNAVGLGIESTFRNGVGVFGGGDVNKISESLSQTLGPTISNLSPSDRKRLAGLLQSGNAATSVGGKSGVASQILDMLQTSAGVPEAQRKLNNDLPLGNQLKGGKFDSALFQTVLGGLATTQSNPQNAATLKRFQAYDEVDRESKQRTLKATDSLDDLSSQLKQASDQIKIFAQATQQVTRAQQQALLSLPGISPIQRSRIEGVFQRESIDTQYSAARGEIVDTGRAKLLDALKGQVTDPAFIAQVSGATTESQFRALAAKRDGSMAGEMSFGQQMGNGPTFGRPDFFSDLSTATSRGAPIFDKTAYGKFTKDAESTADALRHNSVQQGVAVNTGAITNAIQIAAEQFNQKVSQNLSAFDTINKSNTQANEAVFRATMNTTPGMTSLDRVNAQGAFQESQITDRYANQVATNQYEKNVAQGVLSNSPDEAVRKLAQASGEEFDKALAKINLEKQMELGVSKLVTALNRAEETSRQQAQLFQNARFDPNTFNQIETQSRLGNARGYGGNPAFRDENLLAESKGLDSLGLPQTHESIAYERGLQSDRTYQTLSQVLSNRLGRPVGADPASLQAAAEDLNQTGTRQGDQVLAGRVNAAVGLAGADTQGDILKARQAYTVNSKQFQSTLDSAGLGTSDRSLASIDAALNGGQGTNYLLGIIAKAVNPTASVPGAAPAPSVNDVPIAGAFQLNAAGQPTLTLNGNGTAPTAPDDSKKDVTDTYTPPPPGKATNPFAAGFQGHFQSPNQIDPASQFEQVGGQVANSLESRFTSMWDSFTTGANKGKNAFREFAASVFADASHAFGSMAVQNLFSALLGPNGGVLSSLLPQSHAKGGEVTAFAGGGTVPVKLTGGEFYFSPESARAIGYDKLKGMNSGYAGGGMIKGGSGLQDDVYTRAPAGSFILKKSQTERYGAATLQAMANGHAKGGFVESHAIGETVGSSMSTYNSGGNSLDSVNVNDSYQSANLDSTGSPNTSSATGDGSSQAASSSGVGASLAQAGYGAVISFIIGEIERLIAPSYHLLNSAGVTRNANSIRSEQQSFFTEAGAGTTTSAGSSNAYMVSNGHGGYSLAAFGATANEGNFSGPNDTGHAGGGVVGFDDGGPIGSIAAPVTTGPTAGATLGHTSNVSITINQNGQGGATSDTKANSTAGSQFADLLSGEVDAKVMEVLTREVRAGGLLSSSGTRRYAPGFAAPS